MSQPGRKIRTTAMGNRSEDASSDTLQLQMMALRKVFGILEGHVTAQAVTAAMQLQIPAKIAAAPDGALTVAELAEALPADAPNTQMLRTLLRLLVLQDVLTLQQQPPPHADAQEEARYGVSEWAREAFVGNDCLGQQVMLQTHPAMSAAWASIAKAILAGPDSTPFALAHGARTLFEVCEADQSLATVFYTCSVSRIESEALLRIYDGFSRLRHGACVMEVGGGSGAAISAIKRAFPHFRAVNFDLPSVVAMASLHDNVPGVELVGGDMFQELPPADAILLKGVLHNWDDDKCAQVLRLAREALPEDGLLVIMEMAQEQGGELSERRSVVLDTIMMTAMNKGKERSVAHLNALLSASGFCPARVTQFPYPLPIVLETTKSSS